jgi:hypothetical protein
MSDLSRLLGDVYGSGPAPEDHDGGEPAPESNEGVTEEDTTEHATVSAPASTPPAERPLDPALDWADETALDEAFASWVPGPSADAPAAERRLMGGQVAEGGGDEAEAAPDAPPPPAEWLFEGDQPGAEVVPPVSQEPEHVRLWTRSDDDILPVRARRRRR